MVKGCGKYIRVSGTNAGGMACGSTLRELDGSEHQELCHECSWVGITDKERLNQWEAVNLEGMRR